MANKKRTVQVELPRLVCYEMLEMSGKEMGWKLANSEFLKQLNWQVRGGGARFRVEVSFREVNVGTTVIHVVSSAFSLFDSLGILQQSVDDILARFYAKAHAVLSMVETEMAAKEEKE